MIADGAPFFNELTERSVLFGENLEVEDLIEIRPPEGARPGFSIVTAEWARRSPSEEVRKARKRWAGGATPAPVHVTIAVPS